MACLGAWSPHDNILSMSQSDNQYQYAYRVNSKPIRAIVHVVGRKMACTCSTCHVWVVLGSKAMAHLMLALSALGSIREQTQKHSEANSETLKSTRKHSEADSEALGSRLGSTRKHSVALLPSLIMITLLMSLAT